MYKASGQHATDRPDTLMLELVRRLAAELRRQSGVASVTVSASPPTRRTSGTVP